MNRRVTIVDIANTVGVNRSTVSRALRQDPRITAETIQKVQAVAKKLGYVPNAAARALAQGGTQTIMVYSPGLTFPFPNNVLAGIEKYVNLHNFRLRIESAYHLFSQDTGDSELINKGMAEAARDISEIVESGLADGLIMIILDFPSPEVEELIHRLEFPVVMVEGRGRWAPTIGLDNRLGGEVAARHLVEQGRKNLGIVSGNRSLLPSMAERFEGFQKVIKESEGVSCAADIEMTWHTLDRMEGVAEKLLSVEKMDGVVFASGDAHAIDAMARLRRRGIKLPQDIAVVGFDDLPEAAGHDLTTVAQPLELFGKEAAETVIKEIKGEKTDKPQVRLFEPKLVVRGSTRRE